MSTIKHDLFDKFQYKRRFDKDYDFSNHVSRNSRYFDGYSENVADLFQAMFQKNPTFTDEGGDPILQGFLEAVKDTDEYKRLRARSAGNPNVAFFATKEIEPKFFDLMLEKYNELKDKKPEEQAEGMRKGANKLRREFRKVLKDSEQDVQDYADAQEILGKAKNDPGSESQKLSPEKAIELANKFKNSDMIRNIVKMIGRMQRTARAKLQTKVSGRTGDEIVGITYGNNLEELLPEEIASLDHPVTRDLTALRFVNEETMQNELRTKDSEENGAIVFILDESVSMEHAPIELGKAMLFGMWLIAMEERRPFHVIRFGSSTCCVHQEISTGEDMMNIMCSFLASGGTDFNPPIEKAIEIINGNPRAKNADIIMVTDGEGYLTEELRNGLKDIRERLNFKMLGLEIRTDVSEFREARSYLQELDIFDKFWMVKNPNMNDPRTADFISEAFSI